MTDTIAAIATPPGEGGIGIVRISGPDALAVADRLVGPNGAHPSRQLSHTVRTVSLFSTVDGDLLDDALVVVFRAPHSYTGEDVVELQCHGGRVTLARVLSAVLCAGARPARPGEFTYRAFMNGRIDLAQAEAVCDQIRARTVSAQRAAVHQREGMLSRRIAELKDRLVGALAAVEATIDFSEEIGELDRPALVTQLDAAMADVGTLLRDGARGRVYRDGVRIAIVGRPNVGKSSLMNALLRADRAIVTPTPGTTRDTIKEATQIEGIPVVAIDTAGIRAADDEVEAIGVERTIAVAETADVIVLVVDAPTGWLAEDAEIAAGLPDTTCIAAVNKIDLVNPDTPDVVRARTLAAAPQIVAAVPISALTGVGVPDLEATIASLLLGTDGEAQEPAAVSNARHLAALDAARVSLVEARSTLVAGLPADFVSIDLRGAVDALGVITGETATEDIVHRIFQDFCIGK